VPTPKYHIYIDYAEPEKGGFRFNITEEELRRTFSDPFNEGKPFWFLNRLLNPIKVKKALIFWSYDEANLLDLPNDERVVSAKDKKYLIDCLQKSKVKGAYVCTDKFLDRHQAVAAPVAAGSGKRRVLIVSGADKEMRTALNTALTKLLLVPVMLCEEPGNGRKIIERFNDYNDIGLVVALLSPDDYAYPAKAEGSKRKLQPRREVTFELAYLIGRMGPEKVLAFYRETPNFETDKDFEGINAIPFDDEGTWKHSLLSELAGNGYVIEPDRILK
jgi:predicted nucleotide-binding protein